MANIERFDSDSKDSRVSVLTGKSAITLSVSGVPEEQFKDLCREVQMSEGQMSEGKKTMAVLFAELLINTPKKSYETQSFKMKWAD